MTLVGREERDSEINKVQQGKGRKRRTVSGNHIRLTNFNYI